RTGARGAVASRTRRCRRRVSVPARAPGRAARRPRPARRASRTARCRACARRAGHPCVAPGGRCRSSVEAERADLVQYRHDGLFVAAIVDLTRELAKRLYGGEPLRVVLLGGDVDEADAVLEPEGLVAKIVRPRAVQLLV